jgi:hypothetical protein
MLNGELRHTHFPYCLDRQEDGTHVVLNRNYKPIGFMTGTYVEYGDYPVGVKVKGLGPKTAAKLDYQGREDLERIYLYNDACIPTKGQEHMQAYLARLGVLMGLGIDSKD